MTSDAERLHRRAILFMIVAPLCWSSGGLLVRLLSFRDAWEIVFWRSLFMALFVAGTLIVMHGRAMPAAVRSVGWPGLLSAAFLAGQFFLFIASLTRTTVANTFVLMSVSPFLAALAARLFLGERVPMRTWIAMTAAFAGMVVMFSESIDAGRLSGNLLAVGVSCLFALNVTVLRKVHAQVDMLPTVMIAGLMSIVVALPLAAPFEATPRDFGILAVLGCVQLGTGCLLMVAASRHLTATELGLLALLEPILGPIWVWVLLGEDPGRLALVGGAIVLGAVVANEAWAAWRGRGTTAALAPPTPGP
ncbi:MAG TPA: DMT family transporter [Casimicrobiaceae bacterium]|nr:DMT family transporter [Casimicrobiaceae bacterium]